MKSFTSKPPSRVSDRVSVYTPRLNTRPNFIFNNLNAAGSYNFKDLERAVLYFILFYFQMPKFGFCSPNIAPNPPPIFNMALKFLLNKTKTMTTAFFYKKIFKLGFSLSNIAPNPHPVIQYGIKFGTLLNKAKSMATPS